MFQNFMTGSQKSKRGAPPPPPAPVSISPTGWGSSSPREISSPGSQSSRTSHGTVTVDQGTSPLRSPHSTPAKQERHNSPQACHDHYHDNKVPEGLALDLVELVRRNTDLSYDKSRIAVGSVLGQLRESVPGVSHIMDDILKNLLQIKVSEHAHFLDSLWLRYC